MDGIPTLAASMEQIATDILFIDVSSNVHRHSITRRAQRNLSNDCNKRESKLLIRAWHIN